MSHPSPGFMAAATASKPAKIVIVGSGEISRAHVEKLVAGLDEKDRGRIEIVSAATAAEVYGLRHDRDRDRLRHRGDDCFHVWKLRFWLRDVAFAKEREDRERSRVHRRLHGILGRPSISLAGAALTAALLSKTNSASMPATYNTSKMDTSKEPEFLTDAEISNREAGSMEHDASDTIALSAAEEKRARKAAKRAENEARAAAGRRGT